MRMQRPIADDSERRARLRPILRRIESSRERIRIFNPFVDVTITSRVVYGETVRPEMRRKSALKFAIN